jgi:hypothetical protein
MKKNNLSSTGLSLSQARSISNLCNQRASEISRSLNVLNNISKQVIVDGETLTTVSAKPLPANFIDLLKEKAALHACQAFLMENMSAKENSLLDAKKAVADTSSVIMPIIPKYTRPNFIGEVTEDFGWDQLTTEELNKFIEAEAYASHIGKFIHDDGILTRLRAELPNIPELEWMQIKDGQKSPIKIVVHHKSEDLLFAHETLAAIHREYEQTVNYYKAKVKNLTTLENARIAKLNADAQNEAEKINNDLSSEYEKAEKIAGESIRSIKAAFEKQRQANISSIAALRIQIDSRFQPVIDKFLPKVSE